MKNISEQQAMAALEAAAAKRNIPVSIFIAECENAIQAAWSASEPEVLQWQHRFFPEGKPSVPLFIARMCGALMELSPYQAHDCCSAET